MTNRKVFSAEKEVSDLENNFKDEEKKPKYDDSEVKLIYLRFNAHLMKFMAIYPLDNAAPYILKILFQILRYINLFFLFTYPIFATIFIYKERHADLAMLALCMVHNLIFLSGVIRTVYFIKREYRLKFIIHKMTKMFKWKTETDINAIDMGSYTKFADYFTIFWQINLIFTSNFMTTLPMAFFHKRGYYLPLPAWYPWDWEKYFFVTYVFQIFNNFFVGFTYANPDALYVAFAVVLARQWDILSSNFENYIYTALIRYGIPYEKVLEFSKSFNNLGIDKDPDNPKALDSRAVLEARGRLESGLINLVRSDEFQPVLRKVFAELIEYHKELVEYSAEVQDFISPFVFMILFFGTAYLIFIVFCAATSDGSSYLLGFAQYFITATGQHLIFSWFGHLLMEKSSYTQSALFNAPWYICTEKFKSIFKFAHLRLKNPVQFTGANFFIMRLEIFITIMRTVFSFYTLLKQMNAKEKK